MPPNTSVLTIRTRLEDPFVGFNEIKAEWVGTKSWTYRNTFSKAPFPSGSKAVLAFDGLDTFAHVRLDGQTILQSDNMFLPHRVDVTHTVGTKEDHELEIEFDPAFLRAREIQRKHPEHKFICFNGDPARLAVRKAQYHWGWDWGPLLMCAGIWRPVRLEVYTARIADLRTDIEITEDHGLATIHTSAEIESHGHDNLHARFTLALGNRVVSWYDTHVSSSTGTAVAVLKVDNPELWMPNGYGKQTMYTVSVTISTDGEGLHTASRRIGLRTVQLVQEPDSHGKSFYFRINGVDIFCGGSCWIPADSFLTNVTPERYRAWIELMVPANQKMIRYCRRSAWSFSMVLMT